MMSAPTEQLLTADDLAALPDDGWSYELVQGRLLRMAPASWVPGVVSARVGRHIDAFVEKRRLGYCSTAEGGFLLQSSPDTVRAPDVGFVRAERVPPGEPPRRYFPGPPDLAVEVRSPTDRVTDILRKIADYLEAGTRLVWYLDPERRSAAVYRPDGSIAVFGADGVLDGEDGLPGFTLRLADVWV
jgi:Uma2 family endonuclease